MVQWINNKPFGLFSLFLKDAFKRCFYRFFIVAYEKSVLINHDFGFASVHFVR